MYEKIKKWYKQGLWTIEMVQTAFEKRILTEDQLKDIINDKEA